jgi:hypothetical protein
MKHFTVALSHDVDRVHKSFQSATHFLKHIRNGRVGLALYQAVSFAKRQRYWCFDQIQEIENSFQTKSTYFFLNESYPFHPINLKSWRLSLGYYDIFRPKVAMKIRQLKADGFEIGLHGSYRSYCSRTMLQKEKKDLESIVGSSIEGIRQHYLNLSPDTWQLQRSVGFLYDASFGYRDRIGFKEGVLQPFPLDEKQDFFVIPQTIMDSCLMRLRDPWKKALEIISFAQQTSAFLVLNWHQQIFDEREFPGYKQMYVRILQECRKRKAEFSTLGSYIKNNFAGANCGSVIH